MNSSSDDQYSRFHDLIQKKRRFIFGLTLFFFSYFLLLPILTSVFPEAMSYPVYNELPFAWIFAFSQFILTALVCIVYYLKIKKYDSMIEERKAEIELEGK